MQQGNIVNTVQASCNNNFYYPTMLQNNSSYLRPNKLTTIVSRNGDYIVVIRENKQLCFHSMQSDRGPETEATMPSSVA